MYVGEIVGGKIVPIWISIVATVLLGFIGILSFYSAFKTYKDDENLIDGISYVFETLTLLFVFILWVCRKVFSQAYYILAFRTIAFLIGLIMVGLIVLFWIPLDF